MNETVRPPAESSPDPCLPQPMNRPDHILRVLLIEDSAEMAESMVSQLRNAGIPIRPSHAADLPSLERLLEQAPDLVLIALANRNIGLTSTINAVSRSGKDISVVGYSRSPGDAREVAKAFSMGVCGFAFADQPEHVRAVVLREFSALTARRSQRRLEAALREAQRRCDALLESSKEPIAYEHEGMHVRANKAWMEAFEIAETDPIEGIAVLDLIAPESADKFKALLRQAGTEEATLERLSITARKMDGSTFEAMLELSSASYEGEPCHQIILRMADARSGADPERLRQLEEMRSRDLVTDLFNRKYLLGELERAVDATASGRAGHVLTLFEIDRYRELYDSIGTVNIDLLLRDLGVEIQKHLGSEEIAGRLGDHSFAVLGSDRAASASAKAKFADSLRAALEQRSFTVGKQEFQVTASFGGTLLTEKMANVGQVLGQAQEALRQAQGEGGNRVVFADLAAKAKADASDDSQWLELLNKAVNGRGFALRYQPVIGLNSNGGEIYEVVLRLESAKGEIKPNIFLPVAERNGMLAAIDRWVIGEAIRSAVAREKAGHTTRFFVKLSAASLDDPGLLKWIAQQMAEARLPGDTLVFEMAESTIVTNLKTAREFLKGLESIKSAFALEQFGLGLNSFQLIRQIPVRYLKIDRNFMVGLPANKENENKIRDICVQAKHAGKLTIAEFVEDAASMTILFGCGVNFVQGNFLREPERTMSYDFGIA